MSTNAHDNTLRTPRRAIVVDVRKTHRCPKCDHDRILHVTQVADRAGDSWERLDTVRSPIETRGNYFAWRLARAYNPEAGQQDAAVGLVEAYVCRKCGYTELYTRGFDAIEPDGDLIRELRAPQGDGPFR